METASGGKYTVVARRYRPKTFAELVGQSTVVQALLNAIQTNRVGHAYLFTGARGVGKTSTARIFAKALNVSASGDGAFDPNSDIAQAIDTGEDMDVIEIDGASNRGIEEIRQLRANASVRPSRSPYKIYIIDEVHMLTTQAFNALLKTLEEPPGHVKFIFCTTDPEKIPITVLSRCQRFDFPPVKTGEILERLQFICQNEGKEADDAALNLIARRAAGSMRDSQSLLEQLLSFSGARITVDDVHSMLGTADETRLASFSQKMIQRDAAGALRELHEAANEGVDVGQLAEQLLGYLRDIMAVTVGAPIDLIRTANPNSAAQLKNWGEQWGTMTLISALQILDETIVKMKHSVQSRVLMEIALVQICQLQDLQSLSDLLKAFAAGQSAPPPRVVAATVTGVATTAESPSKKKDELIPPEPTSRTESDCPSAPKLHSELVAGQTALASTNQVTQAEIPISTSIAEAVVAPEPIEPPKELSPGQKTGQSSVDANAVSQSIHDTNPTLAEPTAGSSDSKESLASASSVAWRAHDASDAPLKPPSLDELTALRLAAEKLGGLIVQCIAMIVRVEVIAQKKWKAFVTQDGQFAVDYFQTGENSRRLALALSEILGHEVQIEYMVTNEPAPNQPGALKPRLPATETSRPSVNQAHLIRGVMNHPLIKLFVEKFDGQIVRVDPPQAPRSHLQLSEEVHASSSREAAEEVAAT